MTVQEFEEMENSFYGYCTICQDWTRDCTEADADQYDCPVCGENTVVGAGNALIMGIITID